jgi:hypothetical protein
MWVKVFYRWEIVEYEDAGLNTESDVFWAMKPCSPLQVQEHLEEHRCFHLQGRKVSEETRKKQRANRAKSNKITVFRQYIILLT